MRNIVSIDPFRARMWSLHDRCDEHVNEETCRAEIESFKKHGQLVPALGRVLRGDPDHDIELIYGARRLFVARHLNMPLLVELREIADREALIAMDIENRQRTDISPYERATSYARWLSRGYFGSQEEISRALKISSTRVSRLLRMARLPSVILNAFTNPLEIREAWGLHIMDVLDHPHTRQRTIQAARALGALSQRLPAKTVYRELIAASTRGHQLKSGVRVETVRDKAGAPLFRIRQLSTSVAVDLPREKLSVGTMAEIRAALAGILLRGLQNIPESKRKRLKDLESQQVAELSEGGPDDASVVNQTAPPGETAQAQDMFCGRSLGDSPIGIDRQRLS